MDEEEKCFVAQWIKLFFLCVSHLTYIRFNYSLFCSNGGKRYRSSSYLAYHLKKRKTFHLSPSELQFAIFCHQISLVCRRIVIVFYEPSLTKFIYKRLIDPFLLLFSVKYYTGINNGSIREERIRNISSFIYEFGMARFVSRNDNSCLHTREVWWQKNENFILEG